MKIAITGHGNVGGALARNWAAKGHDLLIGARNPEDDKVLLLTEDPRIPATGIPEAVTRPRWCSWRRPHRPRLPSPASWTIWRA